MADQKPQNHSPLSLDPIKQSLDSQNLNNKNNPQNNLSLPVPDNEQSKIIIYSTQALITLQEIRRYASLPQEEFNKILPDIPEIMKVEVLWQRVQLQKQQVLLKNQVQEKPKIPLIPRKPYQRIQRIPQTEFEPQNSQENEKDMSQKSNDVEFKKRKKGKGKRVVDLCRQMNIRQKIRDLLQSFQKKKRKELLEIEGDSDIRSDDDDEYIDLEQNSRPFKTRSRKKYRVEQIIQSNESQEEHLQPIWTLMFQVMDERTITDFNHSFECRFQCQDKPPIFSVVHSREQYLSMRTGELVIKKWDLMVFFSMNHLLIKEPRPIWRCFGTEPSVITPPRTVNLSVLNSRGSRSYGDVESYSSGGVRNQEVDQSEFQSRVHHSGSQMVGRSKSGSPKDYSSRSQKVGRSKSGSPKDYSSRSQTVGKSKSNSPKDYLSRSQKLDLNVGISKVQDSGLLEEKDSASEDSIKSPRSPMEIEKRSNSSHEELNELYQEIQGQKQQMAPKHLNLNLSTPPKQRLHWSPNSSRSWMSISDQIDQMEEDYDEMLFDMEQMDQEEIGEALARHEEIFTSFTVEMIKEELGSLPKQPSDSQEHKVDFQQILKKRQKKLAQLRKKRRKRY